ncbi:Rhamnulokinase [Streptomyces griseomycini]
MSAAVKSYAAVDLGASSGRVMVGRVGPDSLELTEAHRFPNRPVRVPEGLRWDVLGLYAGVLDGLEAAGAVDSVGIDSWAVDYGLLDADGALLGNPVHYRDSRTEGVAEKVWATVPAEACDRCTSRRSWRARRRRRPHERERSSECQVSAAGPPGGSAHPPARRFRRLRGSPAC